MQYRVKPAGLLSCCGELEEVSRRLRQDCEALDNAIRRLNQLSYMEVVCSQLRRERDKLGERIQFTLSIAQAARRCRNTYLRTEQQIMEDLDCPRHVLTESGAGMGGQTSVQATEGTVRTTAIYQSEFATGDVEAVGGGLDWELEMGSYAAAFARAGIDVRLEE